MNYWHRVANRRLTRRRSLASMGSLGLGAVLLAACGGEDEKPPATSPGSTAESNGQAATQEPQVSSLLTPGKDESAQALKGGVFKHFEDADFFTFEPQSIGGNAATTFRAYSGLLKEVEGVLGPPQGEVEGDVAESWEMAPDRLSVTFKIKENAGWPPLAPVNGRTVDAEDIVVTLQRHSEVSNRRFEFFNSFSPAAPITSATAIDSKTVRVDLAFPFAPTLSMFGLNFLGGLWIVPKESTDPAVHDPSRSVLGTGPWYMDEYEPSVRSVWKANPGYPHEGLPYMDTMEAPILGEYAAGLAQFRTGAIYQYDVNAEDLLPTKRDIPDIQITPTPVMTSILWHVIPGRQGPFVDERLRQAYVMTWDREAILDAFYNISAFEAEGFPVGTAYESGIQANHWQSWFLNARDESEIGPNAKYFQFDLAEAKRLVEAAGFPEGVSFKIHHPQPGINALWQRMNEVVAGQVNNSGLFKGEFAPHDRVVEFIPKYQGGKAEFDGLAHYYANQPMDPTQYLFTYYHPSGGQVGLTDDKMTDLIEKSIAEFDIEKRKELTWEFQRYEAEKQVFPRMGAATTFTAYWPAMRNINVYAQAYQNYARWFLDPSKPPIA
ncbi:MAG TPA: ABC transporter substrate-binding protein [Dehalococcoidia bacterium]|nr:ABC transporter substrate-binding protein [Dehalococcoidia bacterium]